MSEEWRWRAGFALVRRLYRKFTDGRPDISIAHNVVQQGEHQVLGQPLEIRVFLLIGDGQSCLLVIMTRSAARSPRRGQRQRPVDPKLFQISKDVAVKNWLARMRLHADGQAVIIGRTGYSHLLHIAGLLRHSSGRGAAALAAAAGFTSRFAAAALTVHTAVIGACPVASCDGVLRKHV